MKGHFKTALGQVTIILDAKVTEQVTVRDLVTVTPASADTPASVALATAGDNDGTTAKDNATHIVALSDMTLEGHVNVKAGRENERYSDVVAATTGNETKKVGLYKIIDKDDIIEG